MTNGWAASQVTRNADTTILVRANKGSRGLARQLLLDIVASRHTLLLSSEILYELATVLRYPRLQALYGLPETRILLHRIPA